MILGDIGMKILLDLSAWCWVARGLYRSRLNDSLDHRKISGFYQCGLLRISESVRAYAYLIPSSQASARSSIVGNQ